MTRRFLPWVLVLAGFAGCARAAAPPAQAVDIAKFDALRRAASSVPDTPGATATRDTLAGTIKAFAAEMARLKTQPLNAAEQPIYAEYQKALDAYQFSIDLFAERSRRLASAAGGDRVPVQIDTMKLTSLIDGARLYDLPLLDETLPDGVALKVLPSDAPQRVWIDAGAALAHASAVLAAASAR